MLVNRSPRVVMSSFPQAKGNEVNLASVGPRGVPAGDAELRVYWTSLLTEVCNSSKQYLWEYGHTRTISKGYPISLSGAAVTSLSLLLFAFSSGNPIKYQSGTKGSVQALQVTNIHTSSLLCSRHLTFPSLNQYLSVLSAFRKQEQKGTEENPE